MSPSQRAAVVTGANSGIGLETARGLARDGFRVVMLCRNACRAAAAKRDIDSSMPAADTEVVLCDLGEQASVCAAATSILDRLGHIDVLVNNAGLALHNPELTSDGLDMMLAVNHLGPFLLTNLLLPRLKSSAPARIITVSSVAHRWGRIHFDDLGARNGYGPFGLLRYGETKLMNVLMTRSLANRLGGSGVTANCLHPGAVHTNIGGPSRALSAVERALCKSAEQGARIPLFLAIAPHLETVSGGYFVNGKRSDAKLSKRARDPSLAQQLWEVSEQLVGLRRRSRTDPFDARRQGV
jgi:NAD(P)-dependent dehydrogenase (short-subunit alcohol dehydrogenase family)